MGALLRVKKVTPRVLINRERAKLSFGRFRRGLLHVYQHEPEVMHSFPKGFWHDQYDLWVKGDRSANIHDSTCKAMLWCEYHDTEVLSKDFNQ